VKDTREALTKAGDAWRNKLHYPVLGITGTNGKTSTKDLILRLLALKYRAAGTRGNLNNELGVPLTLLEMTTDQEIAVIEMGASHAGEIADLCKISRPTHGLVTSIGRAHLEGFGSLDALARTKGELYEAVAVHGVAFVPTDDELCRREASENGRKIGYGFQSRPADWNGEFHHGTDLLYDDNGCAHFQFEETTIRLGIPGVPAAITALAALSVAAHFRISAEDCHDAIAAWSGVPGRTAILNIGGITIIDDSYNANPSSMLAALDTLSVLKGKRHIAILGDMNELGEFAEEEHRRLGEVVTKYRLDHIIFVGALSETAAQAAVKSGSNAQHFENYEALEPHLKQFIQLDDVVLVKASRGVKLERAVEHLKRAVT
jgi:UDP-N-acetylmuramoyl-tripeptide--D-alanyl-D-alanine ligase